MSKARITEARTFINPINSTNQDVLNDPYPVMERLRAEAPVYWSKNDKYWLISGHAEISAIFRDLTFEKQIQTWKHAPNPVLVSLIPHIKSISNVAKNWLLNLNPPDHGRVRSLLNKAFTGQVVQELRPTIQTIASQLLDQVTSDSELHLMTQFAIPLPMAVIGHMLGIPATRDGELKDWSTRLAAVAGRQRNLRVLVEAGKAVEGLTNFLRPAIEERRTNPKNDLLSILVQAEMEGSRLKVEELVGNCILLLVAGHETTTNLIGNAILSLSRNPEQMRLLRDQPGLMSSMISEVLRFESPAQTAPRIAGKSVAMAGKTIETGDMCWLLLGSANRDQAVFENPNKFDITRIPSPHLMSFGAGIHRCIGASLAEVELEIAVETLFAWHSSYTLQNEPVDFKVPFTLRGPKEVVLYLKQE